MATQNQKLTTTQEEEPLRPGVEKRGLDKWLAFLSDSRNVSSSANRTNTNLKDKCQTVGKSSDVPQDSGINDSMHPLAPPTTPPRYQKWTIEEEEALRAGVEKHGFGNWLAILSDFQFASTLANRSNINLKKWTAEEEEALCAGVEKHGYGNWLAILSDSQFASSLANRSNINVKDKWRTLSRSSDVSNNKKKVTAHRIDDLMHPHPHSTKRIRGKKEVEEVSDSHDCAVKEVSDPQDCPVDEVSDPQDCPVEEVSDPQDCPVEEVGDPQDCPVEEVSDPQDCPVDEVSDPQDCSVDEVSGPQDCPVKEVSDPQDCSVKEVSDPQDCRVDEVSDPQDCPVDEDPQDCTVIEVSDPQDFLVEEVSNSQDFPVEEVSDPQDFPVDKVSDSHGCPVDVVSDSQDCPVDEVSDSDVYLIEELSNSQDHHSSSTNTCQRRVTRSYMLNQASKLNSEKVHGYLEKLWLSFPEDKKSSFTHIDPIWYNLYLNDSNKEKVLNWIKKKDIFSRKYVFFPIFQWGHWSVLIFCHFGESFGSKLKTPCILLLDSLEKADHSKQLETAIRKFVLDIYGISERKQDKRLLSKMPFLVPKVPQQRDNEESEFYALYYVKLFVETAPESFSPSGGYPYFMKKDWFNSEGLNSFRKALESSDV
ncbi:ulp1 protease family catalytic domain, Homeodomain-like protein [Artemisia annua]|uniref:MYB transcription factor n=1 Tax=Artemisia annua TaxID=35608 RepID=A0A2U1MMD7_ARTAN|nr:ulp1 protease family catalytic domain, Homeodomain-like protein [Artemisia annua]